MAQLTGGSFKRISPEDIKVRRSALNQLVDVIQEDVSGSTTRRAYQVFVTGGVGPGVTSSLYQTVYDQDFTLQTANPIFDMTVGLFESGSTVLNQSVFTGRDASQKMMFASQSIMMREKIDVYKAYDYGLVNFYSDNYDLLLNKVDEFTENIENIALHRLQTVKKLLNINSEENIFFGNNIEKYYSEIN